MKEIKFENILKANDETKEKVRRWRNKEEIRKLMLDQNIITKEEGNFGLYLLMRYL